MTKIVVGVDGSDGSAHALRWAVAEGQSRGWDVVAVMAWGYLDQKSAHGKAEFDPSYSEANAMEALDAAVSGAVGADAAAGVQRKTVVDLAHAAILNEAAEGDLVVVGARGLGGFKGLLLGSVSQKVLHDAKGPVAVIRPGSSEDGPIVVGVDGSDTSARALAWALDEGRARGKEVVAVHGWTAPFVGGYPLGGAAFDHTLFEDAARDVLDAQLAEANKEGVTVTAKLVYGTGGGVLLDAAEGASLVVVGNRGFTGIKGWLLGSVSNQVVQHAPGNVVVVPHP